MAFLTDQNVIDLRNKLREEGKLDARYWANYYGVEKGYVNRAIRGRTFKHLDTICPPIIQDVSRPEAREEARRLYLEGKTYNQIVEILGVAKSSLSVWCRDIVRPRPTAIVMNKPHRVRVFNTERAEFPYDGFSIGIHHRKSGQSHVQLYNPETKERFYTSYPRYLMCVKEKRILDDNEIVVYVEGDRQSVDSYVIKDKNVITEERIKRFTKICVTCGNEFVGGSRAAKACSLSCAAKIPRSRHKAPEERKPRSNLSKPKDSTKRADAPYLGYCYGLYRKKDGTTCIRLWNPETGDSHNTTFVRYLMATHIGRPLTKDEVVVYKEGRFEALDNLILKTKDEIREEKAKEAALKKPTPRLKTIKPSKPKKPVVTKYTCECVICEEKFESINPDKEVCFSSKCRSIIKQAERYEDEVARGLR